MPPRRLGMGIIWLNNIEDGATWVCNPESRNCAGIQQFFDLAYLWFLFASFAELRFWKNNKFIPKTRCFENCSQMFFHVIIECNISIYYTLVKIPYIWVPRDLKKVRDLQMPLAGLTSFTISLIFKYLLLLLFFLCFPVEIIIVQSIFIL